MNYPRAISISIVTYVATLVIGVGISFSLGSPIGPSEPPTPNVILIAMITGVVLTGVGAWWYFQRPTIPAGAKNGFLFGLIASITAFVLDGVLAVIMKVAGGDPFAFLQDSYTHWFFSIMMVVGLAATTLIGAKKNRHDN